MPSVSSIETLGPCGDNLINGVDAQTFDIIQRDRAGQARREVGLAPGKSTEKL